MSDSVFYINVDPNNETITYMRRHLLTGKQLREIFEKNDIEGLKKVVPKQYFKPLLAEWEKANSRRPLEKAHKGDKEQFDAANQRVRIPEKITPIQTQAMASDHCLSEAKTTQTILQDPRLNIPQREPDAIAGCDDNGEIIRHDREGDDTNINTMVAQQVQTPTRTQQARTQTNRQLQGSQTSKGTDMRKLDYLQGVRGAVSISPNISRCNSRVPTLRKNKYYDKVVRNLYDNQHTFNL